MGQKNRHIVIVGGGTSGTVLAARLSEAADLSVTLLETGPDDDTYGADVLEPALAADAWSGATPIAINVMATQSGVIPMLQGRLIGGTSAVNGLATLRGLPADYDGWAAAGLDGWGWQDVADTFIAAERDMDFGASPLHGDAGPLSVRRWRRDELSHAQRTYYDALVDHGETAVHDVNDPSQLPGIGVFPVTIDENDKRLTTSLAYLTAQVRAHENLKIRTNAEVATIAVENGRASGVILTSGEHVEADEVILAAGAISSPVVLLRSGIGPADQLSQHGITLHADLPVGATMSDHLGPGIPYRHDGPRGGVGGPAQVVLVGASNGTDVDYHAFPIAPAPTDDQTDFMMAVFLMRSSGRGSVRLGDTLDADPVITAPPLPDDAPERLRHGFDRIAAWERSSHALELGCQPAEPHDLTAPDAVSKALERLTLSYYHMTSTCPMGPVLDADCRVHGIQGLRVADASVMPTIPTGNTYLGCVMVAERVASKMLAEQAARRP
ncbi:GMC family oxidoreductase [Pyruvatibacter sp.]|uniref:GMC family oxidoreductase n=1 Tax=Pyruvatibacter sp. TaxID=1981328 RepID=UPI003266847C